MFISTGRGIPVLTMRFRLESDQTFRFKFRKDWDQPSVELVCGRMQNKLLNVIRLYGAR